MTKVRTDIRTFAAIAAVISSIAAGLSWNAAFSDESISISATVGLLGNPPVVTGVVPSLPVITVFRNESQTVSLKVHDPDNSGTAIVYTVTTVSGAVVPQNGSASVVGGYADIDFTYYAPSVPAKKVPVTVTLDDQSGAPVTVKTVDFYVF